VRAAAWAELNRWREPSLPAKIMGAKPAPGLAELIAGTRVEEVHPTAVVVRPLDGASRTIAVPQSAATPYGLIYTGTIYAGEDGGEPGTSSNLWSFRQDNITILDVRIERSVSFGSTVRLRPFLDLFNILNNDAYETINVGTGSSFQRPSAILAPRTMRIGFRFVW